MSRRRTVALSAVAVLVVAGILVWQRRDRGYDPEFDTGVESSSEDDERKKRATDHRSAPTDNHGALVSNPNHALRSARYVCSSRSSRLTFGNAAIISFRFSAESHLSPS